jgi:CRP-like cAMP-binding protein
MPENLLEILAAEAQISIYNTGSELCRINERVDTLYLLVMGQVALKVSLLPHVDVILETIQSGESFGLASLITGETSAYTALCQEPCEVITLPGYRMMELFDADPVLGYQMMLRLAIHYRTILDSRAQMIMRTLDRHPEFKAKIDDLSTLAPVF